MKKVAAIGDSCPSCALCVSVLITEKNKGNPSIESEVCDIIVAHQGEYGYAEIMHFHPILLYVHGKRNDSGQLHRLSL